MWESRSVPNLKKGRYREMTAFLVFIPSGNREVKPARAAPIAIGGTAVKCGRVGRCPILKNPVPIISGWGFLFYSKNWKILVEVCASSSLPIAIGTEQRSKARQSRPDSYRGYCSKMWESRSVPNLKEPCPDNIGMGFLVLG